MTSRWKLELYKKLFFSTLALVFILFFLLLSALKANLDIQNRIQNNSLTTLK